MKKLMMAVAGALILAGCNQEEEVAEPATDGTTEVRFSINQLDVTTEPMGTRASVTDANMTDLWLLAYSADTLAAQVHQSATDAAFGSFSLNLKHGTYTFYVVASRGVSPVLDTTAKTITWGSVRDTFWAVDGMTVSGEDSANKTINLDRVACRARLSITDVIPEGTAKVTFTPSHWYYGLNYQTGAAVGDNSSTIAVNIPSSYIGQQGMAVAFMCISPEAAWTTDITACMLGAGDAVLGSATVAGVPMGRNVSVTLSGALLSATRGIGVTLNDTWTTGSEISW